MECFRNKYIFNNKILHCDTFHNKYLYQGISPYEVIRITDGVPLFLEEHLERLFTTIKSKKLQPCLNINEIRKNIHTLLEINDVKTGNVKLLFNYHESDIYCLLYFVKHNYPTKDQYTKGVVLGFYHGVRKNPNAKLINKELKESTTKAKKELGVFEVLLLDHNKDITEGSMSNVFFIKGNEIHTPPLQSVLPGITRKHVVSICRNQHFKIKERKINIAEIDQYDSAFITGTSTKVLPASNIEKTIYNTQNITLRRIMSEFNKSVEYYITSFSKNSGL